MGTKVPGYERSQERKFPGTFVPRERKFPGNERARERKGPGTKVPGNFRSQPRERKVSGTKVPHKDYSFLGTKGLGHEKSRNRRQWVAKVPNAVEILPKIWTAWVRCTNVTDRWQTDGRQHIANVNMSSRSLKIDKHYIVTISNISMLNKLKCNSPVFVQLLLAVRDNTYIT